VCGGLVPQSWSGPGADERELVSRPPEGLVTVIYLVVGQMMDEVWVSLRPPSRDPGGNQIWRGNAGDGGSPLATLLYPSACWCQNGWGNQVEHLSSH